MNIDLNKTIKKIDACLPKCGRGSIDQLHKMYDLTLRLQSQILAIIYDLETFSFSAQQESGKLSKRHSFGAKDNRSVILFIYEPLPAMKRLTEAIEEHWKDMIHAAIFEAAQQRPLPYFEKALVEIEITRPKGSDNAKVWDTSNRAIQVILNNLKVIFFRDDDMEHMAFSVVGRWGENGVTIIRISSFDESYQIGAPQLVPLERQSHDK